MSNKLPSFANAAQQIHASILALGEQGADVRDVLADAAQFVSVPPSRRSEGPKGPALDNPMGRVCVLLHSVARGINSCEGLTRASEGGFYTCMRVTMELCERVRAGESAAVAFASLRARAGTGASGSRGALGSRVLPEW